jgi:hypothetical protein
VFRIISSILSISKEIDRLRLHNPGKLEKCDHCYFQWNCIQAHAEEYDRHVLVGHGRGDPVVIHARASCGKWSRVQSFCESILSYHVGHKKFILPPWWCSTSNFRSYCATSTIALRKDEMNEEYRFLWVKMNFVLLTSVSSSLR